jgi:hypothetical protein
MTPLPNPYDHENVCKVADEAVAELTARLRNMTPERPHYRAALIEQSMSDEEVEATLATARAQDDLDSIRAMLRAAERAYREAETNFVACVRRSLIFIEARVTKKDGTS